MCNLLDEDSSSDPTFTCSPNVFLSFVQICSLYVLGVGCTYAEAGAQEHRTEPLGASPGL